MPTGYTAGIVNGTITTFPQFVKQCMRAFGATIYMRDEDLDKEYELRIPSNYHIDALNIAKEKLKQAETLTDAELIEMYTKELEESKKYHLESIINQEIAENKLKEFLTKAIEFKAPTSEHEGLRKFMIEQLQLTIDSDCKNLYHYEKLQQIETDLKNINVNKIRIDLINKEKENIEYHLREYTIELKRCTDSNLWVEQLLKSLE